MWLGVYRLTLENMSRGLQMPIEKHHSHSAQSNIKCFISFLADGSLVPAASRNVSKRVHRLGSWCLKVQNLSIKTQYLLFAMLFALFLLMRSCCFAIFCGLCLSFVFLYQDSNRLFRWPKSPITSQRSLQSVRVTFIIIIVLLFKFPS